MTKPTKLIFSFEDMAAGDKAAKAVMKYFQRAGAPVVTQTVDPKIKRSSGVSYREMALTFADSQQIVLRVKQTGDIFQVLLDGTVIPIKFQDDHIKTVGEIVAKLEAGRAKFQAKLAKATVKPPPGIKTAAPKLLQILKEKRDDLIEAIQSVQDEIDAIRGVETA